MKKIKKTVLILISIIAVFGAFVVLFLQQDSFGARPSGARLERIRQSPQYHDGVFAYPEATPVLAASSVAVYFDLIRQQFVGDSQRSPQDTLPVVKSDLKKPVEDSIRITWFGHSSYLLQSREKNILVDPVFSARTSPVQYIGTKRYPGTETYSYEDLPEIDYVVVTHDHYDHLDYETILRFREQKKTRFVMPLGVGAHFEKWGFDTTRFCELDWWEKAPSAFGLEITATPARHFSGRGLSDRGKTLWTSYALELEGTKIYLGGDSGYGPHYAEIGQKMGPFDLTILECGQYNYYWRYIHMMPEETVQAHQDLQGKVLWPVHWGKFTLALHPWDEPVKRLLAKAEEQQVLVATPAIGQQWTLQGPVPALHWWIGQEPVLTATEK